MQREIVDEFTPIDALLSVMSDGEKRVEVIGHLNPIMERSVCKCSHGNVLAASITKPVNFKGGNTHE